MSSHDLEDYEWSPRSPAERVLMQLKMQGPMTAGALGSALGITGEAARQQVTRLAAQGLVEAGAVRRGLGRPSQFWKLTEKGAQRFPDTHAALTVQLLDIIRETLGEDALEHLVAERERLTFDAYRSAAGAQVNLEDRVAALAATRTREGYMAEWWRREDGTLILVENHCPICAAATACQGFCRAELAVFKQVLGPDVEIRRSEHVLAGARRCAYEIIPVSR